MHCPICLNPLLIGAQCELHLNLHQPCWTRLNPLLIGAQCERNEEGKTRGKG